MSSSSLDERMRSQLEKRESKSTRRTLTINPPDSIDFSSNDFLSLSFSSRLRKTFLEELQSHPTFRTGSGGSRLLDGNSTYAENLEKTIATFHGAPAGLLFNSGFDANAGLFACVPQHGDVILFDELIHASVHEGMRLSRAKVTIPFAHNSVQSLRHRIEQLKAAEPLIAAGQQSVFIAIESLYSMDGDLAPVSAIVQVVEELLPTKNGHIIIDEAHSTGVYGPKGRGIVCSLGLEDCIFARLHTFGKSLACSGAIVLCSALTREYLINYARTMIYTTFMSFPSLAAIRSSYSLLMSGETDELSAKLNAMVVFLHSGLKRLADNARDEHIFRISTQKPESPIFSLLTSEPRSLAKHCQAKGFVVRPIVPPTVPEGTGRVRVCLHAGNRLEDIRDLLATIGDWLEQVQPARTTDLTLRVEPKKAKL